MIKIIDEPDVVLTRSEHSQLREEYTKVMSYYAGVPISFEEWVKARNSNHGVKVLLKG